MAKLRDGYRRFFSPDLTEIREIGSLPYSGTVLGFGSIVTPSISLLASQTTNTTSSSVATDAVIGKMGEKVANTSSLLYNLAISRVDFLLAKVGSPTGTGYAKVYNSSDVLQKTFGSVDVSTLPTTADWITFDSGSPYTLQSGDRLVFEYNNGTHGVHYVEFHNADTTAYDGTNSVRTFKGASWTDADGQYDACFKLWG